VPGRFKVVRHLREKLSCRVCDIVVAAPAPDHVIARGRAGAGLLAHIVVSKYDDHLPLYRQAEIFARDGVSLETSTLSGWVGATAAALQPLVDALAGDVIASNALHVDDTPVPVSRSAHRNSPASGSSCKLRHFLSFGEADRQGRHKKRGFYAGKGAASIP
jgi:hypothetical protein